MSKRTRLVVHAPDPATEVFLIDGRLRRIAKGLGSLTQEVAPGFYKVRFRTGNAQKDVLVEVDGTQTEQHVNYDLFGEAREKRFIAAIPVLESGTTHEYQQQLAVQVSSSAPLIMGRGAEFFLVVREEREGTQLASQKNVALLTLDESTIADLTLGQTELRNSAVALKLEANPGTYRLRVMSNLLGPYEIFITLCAGWQTQVFLATEDFHVGAKVERLPSLRRASIQMVKSGQRFDPASAQSRLTELAFQGLARGRRVVTGRQVEESLNRPDFDPMFGLCAAHQILANPAEPREILRHLLSIIKERIDGHPDLDALALRVFRTHQTTISRPPTLWDSWNIVVKASRRRKSVVEPGSLVDRIGANLVNSRPWLMHRAADQELAEVLRQVSKNQALRLLSTMSEVVVSKGIDLRGLARDKTTRWTPLQRTILEAMALDASKDPANISLDEAAVEDYLGPALFRRLNAPTSSIIDAIASLASGIERFGLEKAITEKQPEPQKPMEMES